MDRPSILRKLIEQGSDALAKDAYARLCADRVTDPSARDDHPETRCTTTWEHLVAQAVSEQTMTPDEGARLMNHATSQGMAFGHEGHERVEVEDAPAQYPDRTP